MIATTGTMVKRPNESGCTRCTHTAVINSARVCRLWPAPHWHSRAPIHSLKVRHVAHQQLDQWLDQLQPLFDQEKPPTLLEISQHFTRTGVLQSINEALYRHFLEQQQCACPQCGKRLNRKRVDAKRYNTLQGPGTMERPYFYCRDCKAFIPSTRLWS